MNNCQYCNDELSNKRAKNCPACSTILAEANKKGTYGFVMDAFQQAKSDGLTGAAMHGTMNAALKLGESKRAEWAIEYRKQIERHAEEQRNWKPERFIEDAREDVEASRDFRPAARPEPEIYG